MTIWKFPLEVTDKQTINMPDHARCLSVQVQHGIPCLWAQVREEAPVVSRVFYTYGTGHPMPPRPGEYISTYQFDALVFHVYSHEEEMK